MGDIYSKETRSYVMSRIRSKNTKPERKLRTQLWKRGFWGYRLHPKMAGNPDIIFTKKKIAIFVDGDFWHGYNFKKIWKRIKDKPYWAKKIPRNMERDKLYNKQLKEAGWKVLRFWEHQINKDLSSCIKKIGNELK